MANFEIDGIKPGTNLADRFKRANDGVWEMKIAEPVTDLNDATLTASVKDHQGNITRLKRTLSNARP